MRKTAKIGCHKPAILTFLFPIMTSYLRIVGYKLTIASYKIELRKEKKHNYTWSIYLTILTL